MSLCSPVWTRLGPVRGREEEEVVVDDRERRWQDDMQQGKVYGNSRWRDGQESPAGV